MHDRSGQGPGELWPSAAYARQIARLRAAVGQTIYLVEVAATDTHIAIRQTGEPHVLLDVLEFPRPDPSRGLAPHMIVLDDGRGINLGRIARISLGRPFAPAAAQVLYRDNDLQRRLLLRERTLSRQFIASHSRGLLGQLLGKEAAPALDASDRDNRRGTAPVIRRTGSPRKS